MAEKLFEDNEFYLVRVQCDCLTASHAIDFSVELSPDGKHLVYIEMSDRASWRNWREKIKAAWDIICGKEIQLEDRGIRQEDIPALIELLQRALEDKFVYTRGNRVIPLESLQRGL